MSGSFAAGLSEHPVASHAVGEVVGQILDQVGDGDGRGAAFDLAVLFVSPHHTGAIEDIAATVRELLAPEVLIGCTANAVIGGGPGGGREVEDRPGVSLLVARLPGARLHPLLLRTQTTPDGVALTGWREDLRAGTLLGLLDPFSVPGDALMTWLNAQRPGITVIGGLASAARGPGGNRLVLNDCVVAEGAVCALLENVEVQTIVSQGCRPIGRPWVVTAAAGNVIQELAGQPALSRLTDLITSADAEERALLQRGLHVGLVVDEHRTEFERGDFIVRNLLGVDQATGSMAIGDYVEVGHTVQFHVRDADAADEDLREMLAGASADAALLFTCTGRGRHLFGVADHDASIVESLVGPLPLGGMFCAGELGPVGGRNFLHGFTASIALLRATG